MDNVAYPGAPNLEVMALATTYHKVVAALIQPYVPAHGSVVDFGAGMGTFSAVALGLAAEVTCVEPDEGFRDHLQRLGFKVEASLESVAAGSVDFLYALDVLEHIEDDLAVLREWHAALKVGAVALIYVPAFQCLYSQMDARIGHYRRYRKRNLCSRARAAGFQLCRVEYVDSLGFFGALVYKHLVRSDGTINLRTVLFYDRYLLRMSRLLDHILHRYIGKNLLVVVRRPGSASTQERAF